MDSILTTIKKMLGITDEQTIKELEWRLLTLTDPPLVEEVVIP